MLIWSQCEAPVLSLIKFKPLKSVRHSYFGYIVVSLWFVFAIEKGK